MAELKPASLTGYSHSYLKNGFRYDPQGLIVAETGSFGLIINSRNLTKIQYGEFSDPGIGYEDCLISSRTNRMNELALEDLDIEVSINGGEGIYRAKRVKGSPVNNYIVLWEAGKIAQRYEIYIVLENDQLSEEGETCQILECEASLSFVVWPDSFAIALKLAPNKDVVWTDVSVTLGLKGWKTERFFEGTWPSKWEKKVNLPCYVDEISNSLIRGLKTSVKILPNRAEVPVSYDHAQFICHHATADFTQNKGKRATYAKTQYDEFLVSINNPSGRDLNAPFLLHVIEPISITGLCPIVCDVNGCPTGIPIQISKNWHEKSNYLRAFTMLPVGAASNTRYKIRIVYTFYGTLLSASHAQLCLFGWGHRRTRWEQLAIGSSGETFCLDPEMAQVSQNITDVRGIYIREGKDGAQWQWSNCGWGGDWLSILNEQNKKLFPVEAKVAYMSHGPCLTDVRYKWHLGTERLARVQGQVRTLRTDDYARTFLKLEYTFLGTVKAQGAYFLKMGTSHFAWTPSVFLGNQAGCQTGVKVADDAKVGEAVIPTQEFKGQLPFWVSFPNIGIHHSKNKQEGDHVKVFGTRNLIIRSYRAHIQGQHFMKPMVWFPVGRIQTHPQNKPNVDMYIVPPQGISQFQRGDTVSLEVEWMTLPKTSDDYYGPNEAFRSHLEDNPMSWKTVQREALGNNLVVKAKGGEVQNNYPVHIKVEDREERFVYVTIFGGVGAVPLEFSGLASPNYSLCQLVGEGEEKTYKKINQSVHGNDFWQVEYSTTDQSYTLVFNVLLDGLERSFWRLVKNA